MSAHSKQYNDADVLRFFMQIEEMSNSEKCESAVFIAQELTENGGNGNFSAAEAILLNALSNHTKGISPDEKARLHWILGKVYELGFLDYIKAYEQYSIWLSLNSSITGANSALARAVMLRDNFKYSEELERFLVASGGEWDMGLRNDRLYDFIGKYIIADFKNELARREEFKKAAQAIIKADESFLPDFVLKREAYRDKLTIPVKTRVFVNHME